MDTDTSPNTSTDDNADPAGPLRSVPDGPSTPAETLPTPPDAAARHRGIRRAAVAAAAVIVAGAVALGTSLATHDHSEPRTDAAGVPVTYEVTGSGTAEVTYTAERATQVRTAPAHLPWRDTIHLTPGRAPAIITIVLGADGGRATCALTLDGRTVRHATASGPYGRATCTAGR